MVMLLLIMIWGGDEEAGNGIEDNDLFHVRWRVCFGKPPAALAA